MDSAIFLAVLAGMLWGFNMVVSRWGLDSTGVGSHAGAFVSISVAAIVAGVTAIAAGVDPTGLGAESIARYGIVGAIAPGAAQGMFLAAIRTIGPSRSGILVGTSPMFGVVLAIIFIGESWDAAIVAGTLLTIGGGVLIAWEPGATRLGNFMTLGSVLGILTALAFGVRDVAARQLTGDVDLAVWWAATIILGSGAVVIAVISLTRGERLVREARRAFPQLAVSGLLVGFALPVLIWALSRGDVGVVAPLGNGAQVVTVVAVSSLVYGPGERGRLVIIAVVLVLTGGTLIGVTA
jgi:drug/metabolite transporter (DMT)-like permease